LLQLV